jgi:glucan-binding YG repeat protein
MNKKDLKAVLLASALCGAAAVVPVMADEVEQDPVDVQDQVLDTSNDGNAITNDSEVVENTEASGDVTENLGSDSVVNEGSDFSETETTTVVSYDDSQKDGWDEYNQQYYENGEVVKNQFKEIDGNTYYFDEYGYKKTGYLDQGNDCYYFDSNGVMQKKYFDGDKYFGDEGNAIKNQWQNVDGYGWMYFSDSGYHYSGWTDENGNENDSTYMIDGEYYLFDVRGVMQTNKESGNRYYGKDGKAVRNKWIQSSGGYRYYSYNCNYYCGWTNSDGTEYFNLVEIDGKNYAFDSKGYMKTGWVYQWDTWYYFNADGSRASNQWVDDTYYMDANGSIITNRWIDDSNYVGSDGKKTTNTWESVSNGWKYRLGDSGYASQRLCLIDGQYYAFKYDGMMAQNEIAYVSNDSYRGESKYGSVYADANGHLIKGWYKTDYDQWYYFGDDYLSFHDGFITIGGNTYYFRSDVMQTSLEFIKDDKVYRADKDGYVTLVDTSSKTGWAEYEYSTYYFMNGQIVKNQIISVDGNKYYFDVDGKKSTGSFTFEGKNYITDSNGIIVEQADGWYQSLDTDSWYYFKNGSAIFDEFLTLNNSTYYFSTNGVMQTGAFSKVITENYYSYTKYYLADNNGHVIYDKGWIQNYFTWYYIDDDGSLKSNAWYEENGKKYYFNYNARLVYGLNDIQDDIYYFDTNGVLVDNLGEFTGWKNFHNVWYYSDGTSQRYTGKVGNYYVNYGVMETNCIVDKNKYYVDYNGEIKKGWISEGNSKYTNWYYADPTTGLLAYNEWKFINNQWYYFSNQYMVKRYCRVDGTMNKFDNNGVWLGTLAPNTWEYIEDELFGGSWYYINEKGEFNAKNKLTINGQTYYFGTIVKGGIGGFAPYLASNSLWYDSETKEFHWINKDGTGFEDYDGWHRSDQGWYAYFENGKAAEGYKTINGKLYLFSAGYMYTGILNHDGKAYVWDSVGNSVSYNEGWNSYNGQWYYIQNGKALKNVVIDGYYLDGFYTSTGLTWVNDLQGRILLKNGKLAQNEWIESNGYWYYADKNGRAVQNQWIGNYYVDNEGRIVKNDWIGNYHVGADGKWDATR